MVVAHASRDGDGASSSAATSRLIEADYVAEGAKEAVFGYVDKVPARLVTGAKVRTVFTREQPQVSELQLDMGTRVPLADVAPDQPVNGQHPYNAHAIELPIRGADGALAFSPALLQKIAVAPWHRCR